MPREHGQPHGNSEFVVTIYEAFSMKIEPKKVMPCPHQGYSLLPGTTRSPSRWGKFISIQKSTTLSIVFNVTYYLDLHNALVSYC
jgi:hypothetical protein